MTTKDGKLYRERTAAEWIALPVIACECGQKCYQQVEGITVCDDCISTGGTEVDAAAYWTATRGAEVR